MIRQKRVNLKWTRREKKLLTPDKYETNETETTPLVGKQQQNPPITFGTSYIPSFGQKIPLVHSLD